MAVKLDNQKHNVNYSMLSTDTKPTTGVNNGDTLEVLDTTTKEVTEIWRWHVDAWYKY